MTIEEIPDERRRTIYEVAEAIAPSWERRREFIETVAGPVRDWLLRELAPQPGQTVLEVAAGVGDTGFEAAAAMGERGRLISSDLAPAMVAAARRRGSQLALANVEYRVADAARTGLDEASVDGVICRFAYMLLPDPDAAVAEARRVLRPGGRLARVRAAGPRALRRRDLAAGAAARRPRLTGAAGLQPARTRQNGWPAGSR